MSKFQDKLVADGYCDERGAGFRATAVPLPNGECGLMVLCVKGNKLNLYDVDMESNPKKLLYEIDLSDIEKLKIRSDIFRLLLNFEYKGSAYFFYSVTNFFDVKPALKVIEEEAGKR